ncbi:MAG: glycoside hydrolase family 95 protein [Phycisphaerae bacterium]|nr:glycoside hydrolase family 95 protein [Phycisphaerae bacterium]
MIDRGGTMYQSGLSRLLRAALFVVAAWCAAHSSRALAQEEELHQRDMTLMYDRPARTWAEALPMGNGRLGAMMYGGIWRERIQLNEITVWSGGPQDADRPEALAALGPVRDLLAAGRVREAEEAANRALICRGPGSHHGSGWQHDFGSYQTLGDLWIEQSIRPEEGEEAERERKEHGRSEWELDPTTTPGAYRRFLDLDKALGGWFIGLGKEDMIRRDVFASREDDVLVIVFSATKPGMINFRARLDRDERNACAPWKNDAPIEPRTGEGPSRLAAERSAVDELLMQGRTVGSRGVGFAARVRAWARGGDIEVRDGWLTVEGADLAALIVAAATDFDPDVTAKGGALPPGGGAPDPVRVTLQRVSRANEMGPTALFESHARAYQKLYGRVTLDFGANDAALLTTPDRLERVRRGEADPALAALYFQFARYLLISSSRPGGLPANLQGLWCNHHDAPWNADYHADINVQMNYWPAEVANLAELHTPLLDFIARLAEPGARTARVHYDASGWTVHAVTNPWGFTSPGEAPQWGLFPMAGPWLARHLWEHYEFGRDRAYLARVWPVMRGAAEFVLDYLVADPRTGLLVTGPSISPENRYRLPDGSEASLCMGPTMDQQIAQDLFTNCIDAADALGVDRELRARLAAARERLLPMAVGRHGQLMEWAEDHEEVEPGHRHMSHLYGLHPGRQVTPRGTPELARAARVTLQRRLEAGGGHTGWSRAWLVNFFARLGDGEAAYAHLLKLLSDSTLPNLFDNHPPFQIDGNLGAAAGVAEMLVQSHTGVIELLPALPPAWPSGWIRGLRARGDFEVGLAWRQQKLARAWVRAGLGGPCRVRAVGGADTETLVVSRAEREVRTRTLEDGTLEFEAEGGAEYTLTWRKPS